MAGRTTYVIAVVAAVALAAGALVAVSNPTDGSGDPRQTTTSPDGGAPPENWSTFESEVGFELRYPSAFDSTDSERSPRGIPGAATTLFFASGGDRRLVVGHTDTPVEEFRRTRSNGSVTLGFEASAEFSAFESRRIGGSAGYEFTRTWFSGTGAGTEGISCRGLGAVTAAPDGGTVYVVVERCSEDIDDHPPITPGMETTFERILASFERTG